MKQRIAIIGSGISGLTAAFLLHKDYEVVVYEADTVVGGHVMTVSVPVADKSVSVDTGFIIFNNKTYPRLNRLLTRLDVSRHTFTMGFSVMGARGDFEYSDEGFRGYFSSIRAFFSPSHWRLLRDIAAFNQEIIRMHTEGTIPVELTLQEFVTERGYTNRLIKDYLAPVCAAIWSAPDQDVTNMPVVFFANFFMNHHLLSRGRTLQWYTVVGGAQSYLEPFIQSFKNSIHLNTPVRNVSRSHDAVTIELAEGVREVFDQVIFANHSADALRLLTDASSAEKEVVGAIPYQATEIVVHSDASVMPQHRVCWTPWNCRVGEVGEQMVTYYSNKLHDLDTDTDIFVSVNPFVPIADHLTYTRRVVAHPVFSQQTIAAQQRWQEVNGVDRTWFVGAYWGNGFHEDGINSAVRVAKALGSDTSFFDE